MPVQNPRVNELDIIFKWLDTGMRKMALTSQPPEAALGADPDRSEKSPPR